MGRPRKFANAAEKQADYRARKKIEAEQLRKVAENTQVIIAAARLLGLATETMSDATALSYVAGYMMDGMSHKEVLTVMAMSKERRGGRKASPPLESSV